jgi:hypothetical protein
MINIYIELYKNTQKNKVLIIIENRITNFRSNFNTI